MMEEKDMYIESVVDYLNALLLFTAGNERARKKHDVRISLLILHRVVSFLQL